MGIAAIVEVETHTLSVHYNDRLCLKFEPSVKPTVL